jgi:hypothetical protein
MRDILCLAAISFCLCLTGCAIHRGTESDVARWHGYTVAEHVHCPAEFYPERYVCYERNGKVLMFDLYEEDAAPKRIFP